MARAREEADRLTAEAEATARPLVKAAETGEREAGALAEHADRLGKAAAAAANAEASQARVQALEDERAELAAQAAELGERAARLAAGRQEVEAQLAAATDAGDLDAMTALGGRIGSIDDLTEALKTRQAPLLARLAEIGEGTETFATHPLLRKIPELSAAREAARNNRRSLREALNQCYRDRPEAVADAASAHARELEAYALRTESVPARRRPPQTFVRL